MKETDTPQRQQALLLQTIIESLPYPFYVVNVKDYSIVLANAALGPVDSWQGRTCHQVTHRRDSPCGGEQDICPLAHVLRTKEPITVEHIHYNARGEQRYVEVCGYPVFDDRGEVVQMIEYTKDITEAKKAEEEQGLLEDKLRQSQKMEAIGTLAGGIAHDFNNILTAIIGYGEMVKDTIPEDAEARQDIDQVLKAGRRAKDLVQHILTFSRQSQKEYGPIQIHLVIKEALKLLRATIPTTIEIRENIDPRCGSIISEPTAIHQIVMNLCTNAFHVMENTGGTMEVTLAPVTLSREETMKHLDVEPGPYVRLSVRDTGTGIDPAILGRIFEPYFTTKKQGEGTGMGLAVLHGIVTGHHGMTNVESTLGKGAVFHVYLPKADTDSANELTREETVPRGEESILLVDDEIAVAEMEHRMLERLGYTVTSRVSSIEALNAFKENPSRYDLVITDQTMPQMTGAELAKQILEIRPDIPIILCTGYSKHINENNAKAMGIRAFIMKPLLKSEIAGLIRNVLNTRTEDRE